MKNTITLILILIFKLSMSQINPFNDKRDCADLVYQDYIIEGKVVNIINRDLKGGFIGFPIRSGWLIDKFEIKVEKNYRGNFPKDTIITFDSRDNGFSGDIEINHNYILSFYADSNTTNKFINLICFFDTLKKEEYPNCLYPFISGKDSTFNCLDAAIRVVASGKLVNGFPDGLWFISKDYHYNPYISKGYFINGKKIGYWYEEETRKGFDVWSYKLYENGTLVEPTTYYNMKPFEIPVYIFGEEYDTIYYFSHYYINKMYFSMKSEYHVYDKQGNVINKVQIDNTIDRKKLLQIYKETRKAKHSKERSRIY